MAANISPIFVLTPNTPTSLIAAANTTRDGSGSLVFAFSAGTNGSRVDSITFINAATGVLASSSMVQRVFLTDATASNPRLVAEVAIATVTPSNTAVGAQSIINFTNGLLMQTGMQLKVSQSVYAGVQDGFVCYVKGGDY